jgi:hypothetical protein
MKSHPSLVCVVSCHSHPIFMYFCHVCTLGGGLYAGGPELTQYNDTVGVRIESSLFYGNYLALDNFDQTWQLQDISVTLHL